MESLFSLEDLLSLKLKNQTLSLTPLSLISPHLLPLPMQETPVFWSALPFALTQDASQSLILVPTRDGCVFAMVQCTTSSEESDKVLPKITYLTSITLCTDPPFALKSRSSLMNPQSSSTSERGPYYLAPGQLVNSI